MSVPLPDQIRAKLRVFERRRRILLALRGLAEAALVFCCGLILIAGLEWAARPRPALRVSLSALNYLAFAVFLIWKVVLPLRRRPLAGIAWSLETAAGGRFQERIISAVELSEATDVRPGISRWMAVRTIELAAEELGAAETAALLDPRPTKVAVRRSFAGVVAMALLCLLPGVTPRLWLALNPAASATRFSPIQFLVRPGNFRLPQGTPLEIRASGTELTEDVRVLIKWDDGFQETVPMARSGTNEFLLVLPAVSRGFDYRVEAGEARSTSFKVKVDLPPRIASVKLLIEPPAYARGAGRVVEGGSADFLAGSRVRLQVDAADEQVQVAEWIADSPETRAMIIQSNRLSLEVEPTNQLVWRLQITGLNKLRSESQKWTWRPLPDEPPTAKLSVKGSEPGMVQADEILPLQALATDDVGLKSVDLAVLTRDAEVALKPIYAAAETVSALREVKKDLNYNLAELACSSGDELQLQVIGTDLRGQTTRSEPLSFTIGSRDKALEAQLAVRIRTLLSDLVAQADDLQQTRFSWLSIGRNFREQETRSQLPALTVLQSRLKEFSAEIEAIGRQLENESYTNKAPEARFMYRLGTTLTSWGRQQREVLLSNCARLEQSSGTNVFEVFGLGRELFSRALLDLEQYRKVISVLAGVLETDVMAVRCESAQGRYKRGLPVLRGDNIIAPLGAGSTGLRATFFEGTALQERILEQKTDNPKIDNYAPAGRREQWSARYEGDINISQEGEWTFACVADDGVRLTLDGKSILPAEAWANHPATQYKGEAKLTAGWHPVVIEFFQGSSEAKLQFLAGRKGDPLQEVPVQSLRPPSAREPKPVSATNAVLNALAKNALQDRVKNSLQTPANVPLLVSSLTNDVQSEVLARSVREKLPLTESLSSNLSSFASWTAEGSRAAETQADELVVLARDAQKILREELEKYRWRYEGAAALKELQNGMEELREVKQELRQQPWHDRKTRTEQEQARVDVARAWQRELKRATAAVAHDLFETAKRKDATLAERAAALTATTKLEKDFQPLLDKLAGTLAQDLSKDEMAGQIEQRVNELNDRFREVNELQEKINREQVAGNARKAFPMARSFERIQKAQVPGLEERYLQMRQAVDEVTHAQRVAGDYQGAERLESFAGATPDLANGKETTREIRDLAMRTDRNIPSLAQSIPPPMREETKDLESRKSTTTEAANDLAKPRLGMALESARLAQQGDRKTSVAYGLLGEDLGALINSADKLSASTLQPLTERAVALAGEKGEDARQAEIRAANERAAQLADASPQNPQALANKLEEMSVLARQAAGEGGKRAPLSSQLDETSQLAPPIPNWYDSTDPREIAASASRQSADQIQAAPNQWESYNDASQELSEAARQIQMSQASSEVAQLNPYTAPQSGAESLAQGKPGSSDLNGDIQGQAGAAITQPAPQGLDQAEWARLNERLRQGIRSSGIESFSQEHQAAIRAYFERLSADAQKGKTK